jgi:hypothetical protein
MTAALGSRRPRRRNPASGRALPSPLPEFLQRYLAAADVAVAEPFTGITTDGVPVPDLFPLAPTGVLTRPVVDAARSLLAALPPEQRAAACFPLDSDARRRWSNIHVFTMRHGVCLDALAEPARAAALALLQATLSAAGYQSARDVMRLNETIAEITGSREEYGEWLYWVSVYGEPSETAPWAWQIDGHHLILNCTIVGDQLVLTPAFLGSEPVVAESGRYAGVRVFEAEESGGLALMRSLSPAQQRTALIGEQLPPDVFATAFRDNLILSPAGVAYPDLDAGQRTRLGDLLDVYTGRIRDGHAAVTRAAVERHLPETRFAWIGGVGEEGVFYYRIQSPVILVEFDHQRGIALDDDEPTRNHIHTVVRTPNGNDYGLDLLRQHHARNHAHAE